MRTAVKIGVIADDFTGATDLANNLVRSGMRVTQTIGVPCGKLAEPADAVAWLSKRARRASLMRWPSH
jgi:uncharacterized protein YgbK (DUF1537 family)